MSDQFEEEIKALDKKILSLKKPLYDKRTQIVQGQITDFAEYKATFEVTHKKLEEECAKIVTKTGEDKEKKEEEIKKVEVDHLKGVAGIPDFWFKAVKNNNMIWELVKEKDEEILKHLKHVESER